ncbi:MAG TPA: 2-oxoacid:acceptor oxidoreductase family protein [Symbiobacteriaceae bacterium]|nr:2-oxoacid:acceptor oxidoreductase family protein [Symbiobacteriaceae bacterium]
MRTEIRLAGNGGQGLILGGIVLAEAGGLYDGKHVVQTQVYGPESRGGASRADVIISADAIDYPKATVPHVLLIMSQEAYTKFGKQVKPDGVLIYDKDLVEIGDGPGRPVGISLTQIARDELGRAVFANMVALGAIAELSGAVSRESLEAAVAERAPKGTVEKNLAAVRKGYALAADAREGWQ